MTIELEVLEPVEGGKVLFQRVAPSKIAGPAQARISLRIRIRNIGSSPKEITRVELVGRIIGTPMPPILIAPGSSADFQNVDGRALIVDEAEVAGPVPLIVRIKGTDSPASMKHIQLVPHTNDFGPLAFPARDDELDLLEFWGASSNHRTGHQVFALDMAVRGWDPEKKFWLEEFPRTDGEIPQHFRIYGMPVRAMADGHVCFAINDHAEWSTRTSKRNIIAAAEAAAAAVGPNTPLDRSTFPGSPSLGGYGGGGNVIFVKTGHEICLYAHLQPGSIPGELLKPGAPVKRGQYLGKVGWTGDSSHPHIHIHVKKGPAAAPNPQAEANGCDSGVFRPMAFKDVRSIPADDAPPPAKIRSVMWFKFANHSAPERAGLLYPSARAPLPIIDMGDTDKSRYIGVWHPANHIELRVRSVGFASFVDKHKAMVADSFRLTRISTYRQSGRQLFLGVYKRSGGAEFLSKVSPWGAFVEHTSELTANGMRLLDVCTFVEGSTRWFVGVFGAGAGLSPLFVKGFEAFKEACDDFAKQGFNLTSIGSFVPINGRGPRYIGVFTAGSVPQRIISAGGWKPLGDKVIKLDGFRLHDVTTNKFVTGTQAVGVCHPDTKKQGQLIVSLRGYDTFRQHCEINAMKGFRLARVHVDETG